MKEFVESISHELEDRIEEICDEIDSHHVEICELEHEAYRLKKILKEKDYNRYVARMDLTEFFKEGDQFVEVFPGSLHRRFAQPGHGCLQKELFEEHGGFDKWFTKVERF